MFDRVLLILLLLLLPVGIVVSRVFTGELPIGKTGASTALTEKKIEAMMEKVNQSVAAANPAKNEFTITGVIYATESGILKMAGIAPQPDAFLWVWTAATSLKSAKPEATVAAAVQTAVWSGPTVIRPANSGVFSVEVETEQYTGVVEVRLEQGKTSTTIRYNLDKRVQLN